MCNVQTPNTLYLPQNVIGETTFTPKKQGIQEL